MIDSPIPYSVLALEFLKLGFTTIPGGGGPDGKAPALGWKHYTAGKEPQPKRALTTSRLDLWCNRRVGPSRTRLGEVTRTLLVLDSHSDPNMRLTVVDVDDISLLDWALATYGDTPLRVQTGREGGGVQLYYRSGGDYTPSGIGVVGPDEAFDWTGTAKTNKLWGRSKVDVKSSGAYVVAPGSGHASGRVYQVSLPISVAVIKSLPLFPRDLYMRQREATLKERARRKKASIPVPTQESTPKAHTYVPPSSTSTLSPETLITMADGSSSELASLATSLPSGAWHKCFCPCHANNESPSAGVRVDGAGRVTVRCWSSCDTAWTMETVLRALGSDELLVDSTPQESPTAAPPERSSAEKWWCPDIPREPGTVTLLTGCTGTGKSTAMARLAADMGRHVSVAPSVFLASQAAIRYGQASYAEGDGRLLDPLLSVCLPSLLRVPLTTTDQQPHVYDLWLLDEIDALLDMLHSPTIMTRRSSASKVDDDGLTSWDRLVESISGDTLSRLSDHLRATLDAGGQVVAASGTSSERDLQVLARICGVDPKKIRVIEPPPGYQDLAGTVEYVHPSMGSIVGELLQRASNGACGTVSMDTQSGTRTLAALLRQVELPDGGHPRVLEIHAQDGQERNWVDLSSTWDSHDWVVYDQACGYGVDYHGQRHQVHWHIGRCWRGVTDSMTEQLSHRNRIAKERHSWMADREHRWKGEETHEEIVAAETSRAARNQKLSYRGLVAGEPVYAPRDELHFFAHCWSVYVQRTRGRHPRKGYYASLAKRGVHLVEVGPDPDDDLIEQKTKGAWKAIKAELADAASVASCGVKEIHEILDRRSRTPEEHAKVVRASTLRYWGSDRMDLISDTVGLRPKRRAADAYCTMATVLAGGLEDLRENERLRLAGEGGKVYRAQGSGIEAKSRATLAVLSAAGIDPESLIRPLIDKNAEFERRNSVPGTPDLLKKPEYPGQQNIPTWTKQSLAQVGFLRELRKRDRNGVISSWVGQIPRDDAKAMHYLGQVLRGIGVPTARVRTTKGARGRTVDVEHLQAWAADCVRHYRVGRGLIVEEVLDLEDDTHVWVNQVADSLLDDVEDCTPVEEPAPPSQEELRQMDLRRRLQLREKLKVRIAELRARAAEQKAKAEERERRLALRAARQEPIPWVLATTTLDMFGITTVEASGEFLRVEVGEDELLDSMSPSTCIEDLWDVMSLSPYIGWPEEYESEFHAEDQVEGCASAFSA